MMNLNSQPQKIIFSVCMGVFSVKVNHLKNQQQFHKIRNGILNKINSDIKTNIKLVSAPRQDAVRVINELDEKRYISKVHWIIPAKLSNLIDYSKMDCISNYTNDSDNCNCFNSEHRYRYKNFIISKPIFSDQFSIYGNFPGLVNENELSNAVFELSGFSGINLWKQELNGVSLSIAVKSPNVVDLVTNPDVPDDNHYNSILFMDEGRIGHITMLSYDKRIEGLESDNNDKSNIQIYDIDFCPEYLRHMLRKKKVLFQTVVSNMQLLKDEWINVLS